MKDFFLIFGVLWKNQNARRVASNGKKKLPPTVAMILGMLPLALLACIVGGFMAFLLPDAQSLSLMVNVIVSVVQVMVLFLTMFSVMNTLYNAPDTPFLNTLPVKPAAVFFAKFATVYVNTLTIMAALLIPSLLTVSIVFVALGRTMFYGFFALILLIVLVAPILPLFIVTVFSMPLSYLGTFLKGRSVLKTVMSLLFYILLMTGFLLITYFAGMNDAGDSSVDDSSFQLSQSALGGLQVFAKVMYPNKVLIEFCMGISAGKNFGISLAITVGMLAIMLLLAMLFYRRINEKRLETRAETSHSATSYKQNNTVVSLVKKDFKSVIRNTNLAMSCLANIIVCPIITAIMYFTSNVQMEEGTEMLDRMLKLSYMVLYTLIFLGGTNMSAALAYTREGKGFYLSKTLPIRARDSINAKFLFALIPAAVVMLVQVIIGLALYRLHIVHVLLFFICTSLAVVGMIALHIYFDMRYGNVNWNTRQDLQQVSRANKGTLILVFWTIFVGIAAMICGMVMATLVDIIGGAIVVYAVFWSVLFVLSLITFVVGLLVLRFKAEQYYETIGERAFKPRARAQKRNGGLGGGKMLMK